MGNILSIVLSPRNAIVEFILRWGYPHLRNGGVIARTPDLIVNKASGDPFVNPVPRTPTQIGTRSKISKTTDVPTFVLQGSPLMASYEDFLARLDEDDSAASLAARLAAAHGSSVREPDPKKVTRGHVLESHAMSAVLKFVARFNEEDTHMKSTSMGKMAGTMGDTGTALHDLAIVLEGLTLSGDENTEPCFQAHSSSCVNGNGCEATSILASTIYHWLND